jgi:hypothetical protein
LFGVDLASNKELFILKGDELLQSNEPK